VTRNKFLQKTQNSVVTCKPRCYPAIPTRCVSHNAMSKLEVKESGMTVIKMLGAIKKNWFPGDQKSGICASLFLVVGK